jgi:hypothetical protein
LLCAYPSNRRLSDKWRYSPIRYYRQYYRLRRSCRCAQRRQCRGSDHVNRENKVYYCRRHTPVLGSVFDRRQSQLDKAGKEFVKVITHCFTPPLFLLANTAAKLSSLAAPRLRPQGISAAFILTFKTISARYQGSAKKLWLVFINNSLLCCPASIRSF